MSVFFSSVSETSSISSSRWSKDGQKLQALTVHEVKTAFNNGRDLGGNFLTVALSASGQVEQERCQRFTDERESLFTEESRLCTPVTHLFSPLHLSSK